jgi:hypothetical protein
MIVVIAIVALLAAIAIPNFQGRAPRYEREQFIARLNALCRLAQQQALVTHKLHRIRFDFGKKIAAVEVGEQQDKKEPVFVPVKRAYMRASVDVPERYDIRQLFIERVDEMQRFGGGRKTGEVWFYIVPEGLAQTVIINFVDKKDLVAGKPRQIGLVLNPFTAQFKAYDTFQK